MTGQQIANLEQIATAGAPKVTIDSADLAELLAERRALRKERVVLIKGCEAARDRIEDEGYRIPPKLRAALALAGVNDV